MKAGDSAANPSPSGPKPIERAHSKAEDLHEELSIAGAELHLTNTALERTLPAAEKKGDVR